MKKTHKLFAMGALAGLLLTGCSANSGGTGGSESTESADAIPIGALVPLTGGGSDYGPHMEAAIRLAVAEVNETAAPLDRGFKLFVEDGETNPDAAVKAAQKLLNVNDVRAILGTWASGVTLAVAPLAIQAGVVQMHTSGSDAITAVESNGLLWRFQPEARLTGAAVASAADVQGWNTAAVAARNDPSGVDTIEQFTKSFEAAGGEVLETVTYTPEQASYQGEVRKLGDANAEVVFNSTYAPELTVMVKDAQTIGNDINWIAPGWAVNKAFIDAVGVDAAEGIWAVDSAPNMDTAAYDSFMKAFTEETGDTLLPSDTYVFSAYDMVIVLALAMTDCGCDSGTDLSASILEITNPDGTDVYSYADGVAAIKAGEKINYQGASSNLDFDEKGNQTPSFGLYRVQDGNMKLQKTFTVEN